MPTPHAPADPAFLGRGWAFPFALDPAGAVSTVQGDEDVRESVLLILSTNFGERVMRPDFGANLAALAFEPIGTTTAALVRHRVEQALVIWEPRIDHVVVNVTADRSERTKLAIEVEYRVRSTNVFYNIVYPFYLMEGRPR
jgi:phage baseplate assembly protein W